MQQKHAAAAAVDADADADDATTSSSSSCFRFNPLIAALNFPRDADPLES